VLLEDEALVELLVDGVSFPPVDFFE